MEKLKALTDMHHAKRALAAGAEFEATPVDAAYLVANGRAERVRTEQLNTRQMQAAAPEPAAPAPEPIPVPARGTRGRGRAAPPPHPEAGAQNPVEPGESLVMTSGTYGRRDMTAGDTQS
jgi:hypothetical protein